MSKSSVQPTIPILQVVAVNLPLVRSYAAMLTCAATALGILFSETQFEPLAYAYYIIVMVSIGISVVAHLRWENTVGHSLSTIHLLLMLLTLVSALTSMPGYFSAWLLTVAVIVFLVRFYKAAAGDIIM